MTKPESRPRFSPAQRETLTAVLDCLIPPSPERGLPGAGELELADYVELRLGESVAGVAAGLDALDAEAEENAGARFPAQDPARRLSTLEARAARDPALVPAVLFHAYAGYYQHPRVLTALGMEGRPPYPDGYEIAPHDERLLDPVRARAPFYRPV